MILKSLPQQQQFWFSVGSRHVYRLIDLLADVPGPSETVHVNLVSGRGAEIKLIRLHSPREPISSSRCAKPGRIASFMLQLVEQRSGLDSVCVCMSVFVCSFSLNSQVQSQRLVWAFGGEESGAKSQRGLKKQLPCYADRYMHNHRSNCMTAILKLTVSSSSYRGIKKSVPQGNISCIFSIFVFLS